MHHFATIHRTQLLVLIALIISFQSQAQFKLDGTVVDINNNPIEFVNVLAISSDTSYTVFTGSTTDSLGSFKLIVDPGEYLIVTRYLSLESDSSVISVYKNMDLPVIILEKREVTLGEVIIVAKRPKIERKVDRLVFNFNNSVSVDGGTAIDALKVTPGVSVQGSKVSMHGKQSFILLINGKNQDLTSQQAIDLLQIIDANSIKNIEVITTPPANFDASGNIGIINVNLKSPLHDRWKAYLKASQDLATYVDNSVRGKLSIQKGKFGLSLNSSYSFGKWLNINEQGVLYENQHINSSDSTIDHTNRLNWGLSSNYDFSKNDKLSLTYRGTSRKPLSEVSTRSVLSQANSANVDSTIQTNLERIRNYLTHSGTIRFEHTFDSLGRKAILVTDYFTLKEQSEQDFRSINDSGSGSAIIFNQNNSDRNITNYSTKLDFIIPTKFADLDFGTKYSQTVSQSLINYTLVANDPFQTEDQFSFTETTLSGYASGKKSLSKKVKLKVGLRVESTQSNGNTSVTEEKNTFNYTELFPSAHLAYSPSNDHSFSLEYGRRINRPRFSMLNPFKIYISPFSFVSGNPFLRPSFSNEVRIGHLLKGNLSSALYFKQIDNDFSLLTQIEEGTINQSSVQQNYLNRQEFGLSQSISFDIKKRFSSYLSTTISYRKIRSTNASTRPVTEGLNGSFYSGNSVYLNAKKTLILNLELSYSIPSVYGIDQYDPVFVANTSLRIMLFKKKLIADLSVNDIFASNKMRWTTEINGLEMYTSYRSDNPYFSFALSYSFGNKNVKSNSPRSGNNSEKMRSR